MSAEMTANAIENIAKAEAIPVDTIRVLIDHDYESGVPSGEERMNYCRHMLSNASLAMPARIANGADSYKGCFGSSAFGLSTYLQAFSCGFVAETYQLSIDDKPFSTAGINTALMQVSNGKYSNGGMIINPFAAINDGLIDITWISDPAWQGTFGVTRVMSDARGQGGIQAYQGHSTYVRGRKIRIDVPQPEVAQPELELTPDDAAEGTAGGVERPKQIIVIDGEALMYESSITWEVFPNNIEILLDDAIFLTNRTFSYRITAESEKERILRLAVDKIWEEFDKDKSGALDKAEARVMLDKISKSMPG